MKYEQIKSLVDRVKRLEDRVDGVIDVLERIVILADMLNKRLKKQENRR